MKRFALGVTILFGAALLGGCPVYSNSRYCNGGTCMDCPSNTNPSSGSCIPWSCSTSADCDSGYVCNVSTYTCEIPDAAPPEDAASGGGCGICPTGSVCKLAGGQPQCVPSGGTDASTPSVDAGKSNALADGGPGVVDAASDALVSSDVASGDGASSDALAASDGAGTDAPPIVVTNPCNGNTCNGGDHCVNGQCVAQSALCSDTTQCAVGGEACVNGLCVPHCDPTNPCPSGYACDFQLGVCDLNADPCTTTAGCLGGSVCVEGRCVAPCATGDAAACPSAQLCVNGGCIPDEAALPSSCRNDGQSGLLANRCSDTEICLHGTCYPDCDPEGAACAGGDLCKQVTVSAGTYAVCGGATNLGSDCDLAVAHACSTGVCVDGYCR